MPARSAHDPDLRRLAAWVLTFVVLSVVISPIPALAQERSNGFNILRQIFRQQPRTPPDAAAPRRQAPAASPRRRTPAASRQRQPRRSQGRPAAPPRAAATQQAPTKQDDASVVLVVGDFLAAGLAESLTSVFADRPDVKIVDRTNGSSGFVRQDYYDWLEEIGPMVDDVTPAAVVTMIGSNDRQRLVVNGQSEAVRSQAWTREYERRVMAFATTLSERKLPLVWVGLPAFKSSSMTSDMLAFNDIYRRATENVDGAFVDIWDGFVDENGNFVFTGPDINGRPVQLRGRDGINLTRDGKRKVAFYVEKPLDRIMESVSSPGADGVDAPPGSPIDPALLPTIDRTPPIALDDPELDGGAELLGAERPVRDQALSPSERLAVEGLAPAARAGRVDDFTWYRNRGTEQP